MNGFDFEPLLIGLGLLAALAVVVIIVRLIWVGAVLATVKGAGILALIALGYTNGGYVRMGALALLTLAIFPLGLFAAFVLGWGEWEDHKRYCEQNRLQGHPFEHI